MREHWTTFIILLALIATGPGFPAPVRGQTADDSPVGVARSFLDAMAAEDWEGAAALFHPEPAREHQRRLARVFRCRGPVKEFAVETVEELEALPAAVVMARELENGYLAMQLQRLGSRKARVIGHVEEGEWANVLYRLEYEYAEDDPGQTTGMYRHVPHVLMLRRGEEGWRVGSLAGVADVVVYGPGVLPAMRAEAPDDCGPGSLPE